MIIPTKRWVAVGALFALAATSHSLKAQSQSDLADLKKQIQALERKTEQLQDELAATKSRQKKSEKVEEQLAKAYPNSGLFDTKSEAPPNVPIVTADEKGFAVQSPDGKFKLQLGLLAQFQGAFFTNDHHTTQGTDNFSVRRLRLIIQGTVYQDFHFYVDPDYDKSVPGILDAYVEYTHFDEAQLRIGKFKAPLGLELLQTSTYIAFPEFGVTSNLLPNRDIGAQLSGKLFGGIANYQVGIFDGSYDRNSGTVGNTADGDNNNEKDVDARIWLSPFLKTDIAPLKGLNFGVAGSNGFQGSYNSNPLTTPTYVTPGQQTFFKYGAVLNRSVAGSVVTTASSTAPTSAGYESRITPQLYYSWGPFGLLGEGVWVSENLSNKVTTKVGSAAAKTTTQSIDANNNAWQLVGSYVLTGEKASYDGVIPKHNVGEGGWGAWEIVARYGQLHVDQNVFNDGFADPTASASAERSFGIGVNWYLNRNIKATLSYDHTTFTGGAGTAATATQSAIVQNRNAENAIITQFQIAF